MKTLKQLIIQLQNPFHLYLLPVGQSFTSIFLDAPEIITGLTHKNATFPFRTWIKANESFETPQVFTIVYNKHPEWFVEDINGNPISLIIDESDKYTSCFCTG
ncbi:hypothetical protein K9O30_16690 [Clostridium bowmanii]|uniref:hypothetical protein n=1 Tax=Clostridium bowmanii TaxID=132925 RepID=UPI001C0D8954|nr:hypothetical protein [Clostridium bowmanii]MBU3191005.1 hypothetical protein [Clostridium bowmanii]MCA1075327.1 hypothetical protein [Clostridium bowmanii]